MTVSKFVQPDSTIQSAASYPEALDGAASVFQRLAAPFAPHAQVAPDLTIALDPGHLMNGQTLIEQSEQTTSAIVPPVADPRIDRVVIDNASGLVSVITGVEAASPMMPAIPVGKSPVAQVFMQVSSTVITNEMITDERDFSSFSAGPGALVNVQTFTSSGTYTPTPGTKKIIVEAVGGGGSGGGTASTGSSTAAASSGGGAGAYAKSLLVVDFLTVDVTVGTGGAPTAAGAINGNAGSTTLFGNYITCPGGFGGVGCAALTPPFTVGSAGAYAATGGNIINAAGACGGKAFAVSAAALLSGDGGASHFGGGAYGAGTSPGSQGLSPGSGGSGSPAIKSTAARGGGAGADGIVVIHEYA